jgi:hypothetical protein
MIPVTTQVLVPASSYDLTTLATVKDELNLTVPDNDLTIGRWITAASFDIRAYCGRTFQLETVQDTFYPDRDPQPQVLWGGVKPLQLTRWPLVNVPNIAGIAPPTAPVLSVVAGGSRAATKYFATVTYLTSLGETPASAEAVIYCPANYLLAVASPAADSQGLATGWNVYAGLTSGSETLQNGSPVAIGTGWTEPTSGLVSGVSSPASIAVTENANPLCEGVDFTADAQPTALLSGSVAQLTRLDWNGWPRKWAAKPIVVTYQAGFATIPADLADAAVLAVKHRWYARQRDPFMREETIEGVYSAKYWIAQGPGTAGNLPPEVRDKIESYRVPMFA